jgi:large subunit ribosomal protein L21
MYTIVEIGGMQWKASEGDIIKVPSIDAEPEKTFEVDRVLLLVDGDKVQIGKPVVSGVSVTATVLSHGKNDKVQVFKKKRRKNYQVHRGHRQGFTQIKISKITAAKEA